MGSKGSKDSKERLDDEMGTLLLKWEIERATTNALVWMCKCALALFYKSNRTVVDVGK